MKSTVQTKINWWRKHEGKTQAGLALDLDVTPHTVSRYCCGLRTPSKRPAKLLKQLSNGVVHAGNFDDLVDEHGVEIEVAS